jgi:hypothetical protein
MAAVGRAWPHPLLAAGGAGASAPFVLNATRFVLPIAASVGFSRSCEVALDGAVGDAGTESLPEAVAVQFEPGELLELGR